MTAPLTYTNPVYDGYFADPFVWEHEGQYYAVGTGYADSDEADAHAGKERRVFPLLTSPDLVNWTSLGGALVHPDPALGHQFWAPEVAHCDGKFYLYYSIGGGEGGTNHQLRVAVADSPAGPYIDAGHWLTSSEKVPFAIDASPFQDRDGTWYLFYARDFRDNEGGYHAGTALAVDRLVNMTHLAGEERAVLRARQPWTLFKANRTVDGVHYAEWHTLEGAHVRFRQGRYWCLFSGACWENHTYGVDFCHADNVLGPWDGESETFPRLLYTIPDEVRGPGHNSLVIGPDGQEYLAYHAWNPEGTRRQLCIDPVEWTPDGPRWVRRSGPGEPAPSGGA